MLSRGEGRGCLCRLLCGRDESSLLGMYWKLGVKGPANQPTTVAQCQWAHFNFAAMGGDKAEEEAILY